MSAEIERTMAEAEAAVSAMSPESDDVGMDRPRGLVRIRSHGRDLFSRLLDTCGDTIVLARPWDEDGTYTDPLAEVAGRAALHAHIGASFADFPGMVITATSAVDVHHDKGRFTWQLTLPDGSVPVAGTDFVQVTTEGKIRINGEEQTFQ